MSKRHVFQMVLIQAIILIFSQFTIAATIDNWQFYSTVTSGGGSYSPNTFVTVNQTGAMTQLGQGTIPYQNMIDMDPISGFLFGTNVNNRPGVITRINPNTGQWTEAATIRQGATPINLNAISFSPNGTLYGISGTKTLGLVNLDTSTFSPIAQLDIPGNAYGMDFSLQGTLYLTDWTFTENLIRTVDVLTGTITSTRSIGGNLFLWDIDFAPDGYIYHTNGNWSLYRIDPATMEQTWVGFGGLGPFGGIASDNVPEPATLLLLGLGWTIVSRIMKK